MRATLPGLVALSVLVPANARAEEELSLDFLEFVGEWIDEKGEVIDIEALAEIPAKLEPDKTRPGIKPETELEKVNLKLGIDVSETRTTAKPKPKTEVKHAQTRH